MGARSAAYWGTFVVVTGAGPLVAQGADHAELVLSFADGSLTVEAARPPDLPREGRLSIAIEGALPATYRDDWVFTLNGDTARPLPEGIDVRGFTVRVPSSTADSLTLAFADRSRRVSFPAAPLRLELVESVARTGSATVPRLERRKPLYDRRKNEVNLYFLDTGLPDRLPRDVDDNDVISVYLALPPGSDVARYAVRIEGEMKDSELSVMGQGAAGDIVGRLQGTADEPVLLAYPVGTYGPFSGPSITITVSKTGDDGELVTQRDYPLRIAKTYVASLRFGVGSSGVRFNRFGVGRSAAPDTTVIVNRAGEARELRSFIMVAFYGWHFWSSEFWNGRDIEETARLIDRINPMVGFGLDDIGDEFAIGGSFEVARGLDLFAGWHLARVDRLSGGFQAGDIFGASPDELPVTTEWDDDVIVGVSMDLRIAAAMLGNLLGGGDR